MSGDFFRTRMGAKFYELTMPKIADELGCLNKNLERLIARLEPSNASPAGPSNTPEAPANSRGASIPG